MTKCTKEKELIITTDDKPGMLSEVTSVVTALDVNITAICAYGMEGKAIFYLLTSDNAKIKQTVKSKGWKVEETDVAVIDLEDKVGAAKEIAAKLKAKNVNLSYCYGTTCTSCAPNCACRMVLKASNVDAIISALK